MKIKPPGQDVPIQLADGSMEPLWYAFLTQKRNVLEADDVDNSTPITNGQALIYNSTTKKLTPGAN
ncbi:hypothetical protein [Nitrobacter sp. TKz-YC02]|uniref:hypothetical protein n=1 Tax=Nitrobacter sp. TKz-YC02 TaxID=3398704 RepID=UPI003CFB9B67